MAVLDGDMKYIYHYGRQPMEVFNLRNDPGEKTNLAGLKGTKFRLVSADDMDEMEQAMLGWKSRVNRRHKVIAAKAVRQAVSTTPPDPSYPLDIEFGDGHVSLVGFDLKSSVIAPGEAIEFTVYYRSNERLHGAWKPFVHVTNVEGSHRMINADHHPIGGAYPISKWKPGEYITDRLVIALPPTYPESTVEVWTGLFRGKQGLPPKGDLGGLVVDESGRLRLLSVQVKTESTDS